MISRHHTHQAQITTAVLILLVVGLIAAPTLGIIQLSSDLGTTFYAGVVGVISGLATIGFRDLLTSIGQEKALQRDAARRVLVALDDLRAAFGSDPRYRVNPKVEVLRALTRVVRREAEPLGDPDLRLTIDRACCCMETYFRLVRAGAGTPRFIADTATNAARTAVAAALREEDFVPDPNLDRLFDLAQTGTDTAGRHSPLTWKRRAAIAVDLVRGKSRYPAEHD